MAPRTFTLNFMGDTMLGRLIDQMFPEHVHEPDEARIVQSFRNNNRVSGSYEPTTPWGNTLPLLHSAALNILNLETSMTTHAEKWPDKVFNYRMHPANVTALKVAKIDYAGLANNHTLDFCEPGLVETVRSLKDAGIAFAGAGLSREEALKPAILRLPSSDDSSTAHEIHIWAASDHPQDWRGVPTFHFIDYTQQTRARLRNLLAASAEGNSKPALRIFSVHWGPNYSWQPASEIRDLAHFLIDECAIDMIHGHSSHHVQGVEVYRGKLIIYGCGDFVDDYALTPGYRNDLSAIWRVTVAEEEYADGPAGTSGRAERVGLRLKQLEVIPTIIERFRVRKLEAAEDDAVWVCNKVQELSAALGTAVEVNEQGRVELFLD